MHRLALSCAALAATTAFADLTMVSTAVTGGATRQVTLSVKGAKARFELTEEGAEPRTMLRDGDAKKMYIVNHKRKQLVVVTEQDSAQLQASQEQLKAQMAAQLSRLPPEQRAKIEASMLGGMAGPSAKPSTWTYEKKKAPARKIAGFSCQDYVVKRDGATHGEGCFASWKDAGFTAEEFKATIVKAMPKMGGEVSAMDYEGQDSAPGFPVHRVFFDDKGQVKTETTLKSLSKAALSDDTFALPKDYAVKDMGDALKGRPMPTPAPAPAGK